MRIYWRAWTAWGHSFVGYSYLTVSVFDASIRLSRLIADVGEIAQNISHLMSARGDITEYIDRIKKAPILVLDDFGTSYHKMSDTENSFDFFTTTIGSIITYRWKNYFTYPTVLTTNETQNSLVSNWGIIGDRIADRQSVLVGMVGNSYRQSNARAQEAESCL